MLKGCSRDKRKILFFNVTRLVVKLKTKRNELSVNMRVCWVTLGIAQVMLMYVSHEPVYYTSDSVMTVRQG